MRTFVVLCRWLGRILILGAVYVLVCALFLPQGIQVLNPVACPDTLKLDNARYRPPSQPDNERLEVVCTSPEASKSATQPIGLIVVGAIAAGLALLYVAENRSHPRLHAPSGPTLR